MKKPLHDILREYDCNGFYMGIAFCKREVKHNGLLCDIGKNFMIFYKYDTEYAIIKNKISILLRQEDLHESKSDGSGVVSCDHNVAVFCGLP